MRKLQRWKKPSQATLRLTLMFGDGVLLIGLLMLVSVLGPLLHVRLDILHNVLGLWNTNLIWTCLALVSWSIAANITQVQHLNCASNLLKGPLYALCTLVIMLFFVCCSCSSLLVLKLSPTQHSCFSS